MSLNESILEVQVLSWKLDILIFSFPLLSEH